MKIIRGWWIRKQSKCTMRTHCAADSKRMCPPCMARKTTRVKPLDWLVPACYKWTKNCSTMQTIHLYSHMYLMRRHCYQEQQVYPPAGAEPSCKMDTKLSFFNTLSRMLMRDWFSDAPLVPYCDRRLVLPRQTGWVSMKRKSSVWGWIQANDSPNRSEWMELNDSEASVARCHEETEVPNNKKIFIYPPSRPLRICWLFRWPQPSTSVPLSTPETNEQAVGANTHFVLLSRVT